MRDYMDSMPCRISRRLAADLASASPKMGEPGDSTEESEPPLFTQPLNVAQERYVDAHAEVIQRKNVTRERHIAAWNRWKQFNK